MFGRSNTAPFPTLESEQRRGNAGGGGGGGGSGSGARRRGDNTSRFGGAGDRADGGGGGGGGDGGNGEGEEGRDNWVDETGLRAAIARAYDTFALMHGAVSVALDAPTRVGDDGAGSGGAGRDGHGWGGVADGGVDGVVGGGDDVGRDCAVSGYEVLRRLASARKRLRKARGATYDVRICTHARGCRCCCCLLLLPVVVAVAVALALALVLVFLAFCTAGIACRG